MKPVYLLALAPLLFGACSSISVKDYAHNGKVAKPRYIYVAPFETNTTAAKIAGNKKMTEAQFKQNVATILQDYTVQNVTKHVGPAVKVAPGAVPRDGWLIAGKFTRINTGSRSMRVIVGLGAGGSKMETTVQVYDLAAKGQKPFMQFSTTGGSNAMPGLITSGGPGVGSTYAMINAASTGVTDDAARTSRMITGAISEYYAEQGWIPKNKVFKMKKPGEYQLVHGS
jgi:hypothetical protein